jgi:hypothetical protein
MMPAIPIRPIATAVLVVSSLAPIVGVSVYL